MLELTFNSPSSTFNLSFSKMNSPCLPKAKSKERKNKKKKKKKKKNRGETRRKKKKKEKREKLCLSPHVRKVNFV